MKTKDQIKPSYAPVYAGALYPDLARIFLDSGYALAIHGSLQRDVDLVAIPWIEKPESIENILKEIVSKFAIKTIDEPENKQHGRIAYTLSIGFGDCAIDLSFMPIIK